MVAERVVADMWLEGVLHENEAKQAKHFAKSRKQQQLRTGSTQLTSGWQRLQDAVRVMGSERGLAQGRAVGCVGGV